MRNNSIVFNQLDKIIAALVIQVEQPQIDALLRSQRLTASPQI